MVKTRRLHAIFLLPVMAITLLTSACLGIGAGASVSYTPPFPFPPITISIDTDGNITFQASKYSDKLVTEIGTFTVAANVFASLKPEDNTLLLIIRHKQAGTVVDDAYKIQTGQDEVVIVTNGTTTIDVTEQKIFIDASKGNIQSIEVKDGNSKSTAIAAQAPTQSPTPPSLPSPTPSPTQPPTPTPTPTPPSLLTASSRFSGTIYEVQNSTTYQVSLEITKTSAGGSFEGKWFALIGNQEEDVFIQGVNVSFNEINRFSQISPDKALQLQQQYPGSGTLLWFTSTSYDVGQDIWMGCEYYGLLQADGHVQGLWYPPGSNADGGTFQLA